MPRCTRRKFTYATCIYKLIQILKKSSIAYLVVRPKEKYVLFPVTCPKLFRVGRCANFFFIITFLYGKSMEILKNSLKIDLNILRVFKKSFSRP